MFALPTPGINISDYPHSIKELSTGVADDLNSRHSSGQIYELQVRDLTYLLIRADRYSTYSLISRLCGSYTSAELLSTIAWIYYKGQGYAMSRKARIGAHDLHEAHNVQTC